MDKITKNIFVCFLVAAFTLFFSGWLFAQEPGLFDLRETMRSGNQPGGVPGQGFGEPFLRPEQPEAFNKTEVTEETKSEAKVEITEGAEDTKDAQPIVERKEGQANNEDLISINFENVDIRDVIRILANKAQRNMIVGPEITATVNIQLNNVTWERALSVILSTYGLAQKKDGDLIRIMTMDQFVQEEEKIPVQTKILTLNFARAAEVKGNFQNMLSARGRIDVNDRTNSLIVTDIPDKIAEIERISMQLDTRTPQVIIEVLLADVVIGQDDQLGIEWEAAWPDDAMNPKRTLAQSLGGTPASGAIFNFGTTILAGKDLHSTIAAWQNQSRVNILAHPTILTLDNLAATISLTEEIPYTQTTQSTEGSSALSSTAFKSSGINLSVTPHITTKDNFIYVNLSVSQSFRSGFTEDGQPIVDSRAAATNLLVRNHQTAVIGGLRRKNDTFTVSKIPLLGDIPMFGSIFRKRIQALSDTDLMIFVTPSIAEDRVLTPKENDRLQLFSEETEDWAGQFDMVRKRRVREQLKQKQKLPKSESGTSAPGAIYLRPPLLDEETP